LFDPEAIKVGEYIAKVGETKYINRQKYWDNEISALLEIASEEGDSISDCCVIVPALISAAAESYFVDVERLKEFHGCKLVKDEKVLAYSIYWLLKNKPIQIVDYSHFPEHRCHINEDIFSLWLTSNLSKLIAKRIAPKIQIDDFEAKFEDSKLVIDFYNNLRYNFIYRDYTAKSILLMVEGFITAVEFTLQIT
jgi:hypothetical protein